jgi:hypothetical protein
VGQADPAEALAEVALVDNPQVLDLPSVRLADLIEEPGHVCDRPREALDNLRQPLATHVWE